MTEQRLDIKVSFAELIENGKKATSVLQETATAGNNVGTGLSKGLESAAKSSNTFVTSLKNVDTRIKNIEKAETGLATKTKLLTKLQTELTDEFEKYIEEGRDLKEISTEMKKVENSLKGVKNEQKKLNTESKGTGSIFDELGNSIGTFSKRIALIAIAAKVFDFFKTGTQQSKELQTALSELSAITGLVGQDLESFEERAKNIGTELNVSAKLVVQGAQLIGSAKPDLLENADALAAVTKEAIILSKAAKIDLKAAADTLGGSLNQFGQGAEEAQRFINVLAAGQKAGASLISETAQALDNSGTVLAASNIKFEEANAAIQQLSTVKIKASEAGTALRNIVLILNSDIDKFNPSVVGLNKALQNLQDEQLTTTQLTEKFGLANVTAAQNLIQNADNIATLTDNLTATNEAYIQAEKNSDNLEASWNALKVASNSLAQELTSSLTPALQTGSDLLGSFLNKVTSYVRGFKEVRAEQKEVIALIEQLGFSPTLADFGLTEIAELNVINEQINELKGNISDLNSIDAITSKLTELKKAETAVTNQFTDGSAAQTTALEIVKDAIKEVEGAYIDLTGASRQASNTEIEIKAEGSNALITIKQIDDRLKVLKNQRINLNPDSTEFKNVEKEIEELQSRLDKLNGKSTSNRNTEAERAAKQREQLEQRYANALVQIEQNLQQQLSKLRNEALLANATDEESINIQTNIGLQEIDSLEQSIKEQIALKQLQSVEFQKLNEQQKQDRVNSLAETIVLESSQIEQLTALRTAIIEQGQKDIAELNRQTIETAFESDLTKLEDERAYYESLINVKRNFYNENGQLITDELEIEKAKNAELDKVQQDYLQRIKLFYSSLTDEQLSSININAEQLQTIINNIQAEIEGLEPKKIELSKLFGFELSSEEINILKQAFSSVLSGFNDFFTANTDFLIEANEQLINSLDSQISILEESINKEQELYNEGKANALQSEQEKINELKAKRQAASNEAIRLQKKQAREQALADTAVQISNVITAGTAIIKSEASKGVIGLAIGALALGSLFKIIANFKKRAQSEIPSFYKGTSFLEYSNGESGRDAKLAYLDRGERVTPRQANLQHWDIYEGLKTGNDTQFSKGVHKYMLERNMIQPNYHIIRQTEHSLEQKEFKRNRQIGEVYSYSMIEYLKGIKGNTQKLVEQGNVTELIKGDKKITVEKKGFSTVTKIEKVM